jgi:nucleotide-binding universal stress UspA family protein
VHRIVVGVDGSDGGRRALAWAVKEAERWGATLVAAHAWSLPMLAIPTGMAPLPTMPETDEMSGAAEAVVDQVLAEALEGHPGVAVEKVIVEGPAATLLLDLAKEADLLVVGSRGHGGFIGLLLGSVTQHVVHHTTAPVVVVPPPREDA